LAYVVADHRGRNAKGPRRSPERSVIDGFCEYRDLTQLIQNRLNIRTVKLVDLT
jgi:hypothetical protein